MGSPEPDPNSPRVMRGVYPGDQEPDGDVLDHGYGHRPRRGLAIVLAILAAAAVALGYLRAHSEQRHPDATRSSTPLSKPPVAGAGDTCAAQMGNRLVLGARVANQSSGPIELEQAQAILPLNGLRFGRAWWTDCEHVVAQASQLPYHDVSPTTVPAGQTGWVTMVFDVLVDCPAPLPVSFFLTYSQNGRTSETTLGGFPDLGSLPYATPLCTGT